ncbi:MAG TPA: hypothetical protein DCF42_06240 [Lachnospiraceae bacterium]|nr:hypothetical protein [Lachnospiraceae bacterium]
MKRFRDIFNHGKPFFPAAFVALAAAVGFFITKPELNEIAWPAAPSETASAKEASSGGTANKTRAGKKRQAAVSSKKTTAGSALENSSFAVTKWKDGTYTGSARGYGGTITAQVTIKNGKIASIDLVSHAGETPSYFAKAKAVVNRILKKQTPNVDTVSGATYSSNGIREAVKAALKKAAGGSDDSSDKEEKSAAKKPTASKKQTVAKLPDGKPADGTYQASAVCEQGRRFRYQVTVTAKFKGGKLIKVTLSTTDNGANKDYINQAWKSLKSQILADQNGSVDVVSGATYTSNAIQEAYLSAYKKAVEAGGGTVKTPVKEIEQSQTAAKSTDPSKVAGSDDTAADSTDSQTAQKPADPKNGSYSVTAVVDADDAVRSGQDGMFYNYKLSGVVTFQNGVLADITNVKVIYSSNIAGEYEDDVFYTDKAAAGIVSRMTAANSADVDVVSGATCSSKAIMRLYQEAYRQMTEAETEQN